ncbi:sarcosine oxidase subunit gamma [Celeribacter litoreus]|uniref:sarcosine oxidase subunit gamma n=1 Tax=Celeribacter litoreus TaxID=2876714 RepID=UPI001CCEB747|nr:sarcosine oxidase subunit gamma [Celeribacter litoreus]MCA0043988.1 sarcosine oxidase subunit gamma [Celeribacter litoreus]
MTDLTPITALGAAAPRVETFGALQIEENAGLALASLALRKGGNTPAPFGLTLPDVASAVSNGEIGAFWTGRGQWMVEAAGKSETDFAALLKAEAPECIVTEQTDGFVAFEVVSTQGGAPIEALMSKLLNIDPKTFGAGQAVRTGLEHMTVFLIRRSDEKLAVIGMRTLAGSLWHALAVAARRLED